MKTLREAKNGMYGETPRIEIGDITICLMSDCKNEPDLWLENQEGEGTSVPIVKLAPIMRQLFKDNF